MFLRTSRMYMFRNKKLWLCPGSIPDEIAASGNSSRKHARHAPFFVNQRDGSLIEKYVKKDTFFRSKRIWKVSFFKDYFSIPK